jgi:hypothetical protein
VEAVHESEPARTAARVVSPMDAIRDGLGNRGFGRLLEQSLVVAPSAGPHEREADRAAAQVLRPGRSPEPPAISAVAGPTADETSVAALEPIRAESGLPLPPTLRSEVEPRFGADLSAVRLHTGSAAAQASDALDARAFTSGNHIAFAPGQYQPDAPEGQRLIAHELTHVIQQQRGGVTAAAPIVQRESWTESLGKAYDETKWKGYRAIIAGMKATKNAGIGALRASALALSPGWRDTGLSVVNGVDFVADMIIAFALVLIGLAVGFVEGLAGLIVGIVRLALGLITMTAHYLAALAGYPEAYNEDVNAVVTTIKNIPEGLKAMFNTWVERYKKATLEEQVIMGGELVGQIEAFLATFAAAGTKAGKATSFTVNAPNVAALATRGEVVATQVTVKVPAIANQLAAESQVVAAQALQSSGQGPTGGGSGGGSTKQTAPSKPEAGEGEVWVNTETGKYHKKGSHWYDKQTKNGKYMTEAEAKQANYVEAGTARARPPTGVYEELTGSDSEGFFHKISADLGPREARAGLEKEMARAGEYSVTELRNYERAHSVGAGLGAESGQGVRLAPGFVNQMLQRLGIEEFLKNLVVGAREAGETIDLQTITRTHPRTLRLKSITYKVRAKSESGLRRLFEADIEVSLDGKAHASVSQMGEVVQGPIVDVSTFTQP